MQTWHRRNTVLKTIMFTLMLGALFYGLYAALSQPSKANILCQVECINDGEELYQNCTLQCGTNPLVAGPNCIKNCDGLRNYAVRQCLSQCGGLFCPE